MIWKRFLHSLPEGLSDFIEQMRPSALQCLPLREVAPKIAQAWKQSNQEHRQNLLLSVNDYLPPELSAVESENTGVQATSNIQKTAQAALQVYFSQLFNPQGLFIDLREKNFTCLETNEVEWCPSTYQVKFSPPFRQGLLKLYSSFYHDGEALFDEALVELKLIDKKDPQSYQVELKRAIETHFGEGRHAPVEFNLSKFRQSFTELFQLFSKQKKEIPSEFFFLGLYLFSLYTHLDKSPEAFDVRGIYLETAKRLHGIRL